MFRLRFTLECVVLASLIAVASTAYGAELQADSRGTAGTNAAVPPQQSSANTELSRRIDQLVMTELAEQRIPGYALAVIKDGQLIVDRGYGVANLETHEPVTPDTVFGLASLTKTFTAFVLLTLVDEGKVGLEDPLGKYVSGLPRSYQNLTIRQLASMTAGVPQAVSREVEWKHQIPILTEMPLSFQPGTNHVYSNFSYRLIGSVIQNVTGEDYIDVVRQRILQPWNMTSTGTTVSLSSTGRVAAAYGDNGGNGPIRNIEYKNPQVSFAAGMLASTVNDLLNYVRALMADQNLSAAGYRTLFYDRPNLANGITVPWAFGWAANANSKFGGARSVSMNGGTPGVASTIIMLPEKKCAVVALCNLRKPASYRIAKDVAALAFGGAETASDEPVETRTESSPEE